MAGKQKRNRKKKPDTLRAGNEPGITNASPITSNSSGNSMPASADSLEYQKHQEQEKNMEHAPVKVSKWTLADKIQIGLIVSNFLILVSAFWAISLSLRGLRLTKDTFVTANKAFLQIQNLKLINDTLYYSIANLGAYPAKIKGGTMALIRSDESIENEPHLDPLTTRIEGGSTTVDPQLVNQYVIKDYPIHRFQTGEPVLYRGAYDSGRGFDKLDKYFAGKLYFINEGTGEMKTYTFVILLPSFEFKVNDNL